MVREEENQDAFRTTVEARGLEKTPRVSSAVDFYDLFLVTRGLVFLTIWFGWNKVLVHSLLNLILQRLTKIGSN